MEIRKDNTRWWIRVWIAFALLTAALVAVGWWWRYHKDGVSDQPRYAQVKLEASSADQRSVKMSVALPLKPGTDKEMDGYLPAVKTRYGSYLAQASGDALQDVRNRPALKNALLVLANESLPKDLQVDDVLLTNFVVGD